MKPTNAIWDHTWNFDKKSVLSKKHHCVLPFLIICAPLKGKKKD